MIANYHTHTARCRHAQGGEDEYIQNAIRRGLKIFGFSDHTPQWFPGDYYSHMRMYHEQLPEYCDTVRKLQSRYQGQLEIPLGLEVEYYPDVFRELIPRLRDQGIEYILLGQHWIHNEFDGPHCGAPTEDEKILQQYCDQVIEALETGLFTYLAHPDLVRFTGARAVFEKHIRRLCRTANATHTPLEINFLGISEKRWYPNPVLWEIAAEEDCRVVFGIDAHTPEHVLDSGAETQAMELVRKYGLNLLETLPLKKL